MKAVNQKTTGKASLLFALALAFALLLPSIGAATQCLSSVSSSVPATTATTGSDVTITVTPTGSCSGGEVTLSLNSQPSTLTVSSPAGGQHTGVSTGTSKTFTVTASTAALYNITAVGTTSDGSVEATPLRVEFVAPSALTVDGSPSSATILFNAAATLQVNVTNSQAVNITTSYTLTTPSGLTASGDPTSSSSTTINAGNTKALTWTITHDSCFTGKKNVTFQLGDNTNAFVSEITGNSSCSSAPGSTPAATTGGGGGGTNATTTLAVTKLSKVNVSEGVVSIIVSYVDVNKRETADIPDAEFTGLRSVEIVVNSFQKKFSYIISPLADRPPSIAAAPSGSLYRYVEITVKNISESNIKNLDINFEVNKTWVTANNIDPDKISLYRYTAGWDKLSTSKTGEDSGKYFYKAATPGFSVFAVSGETVAAAPPPPPPGGEQPGAGVNQTAPPPVPPELPKIPADVTVGIVAVIIVVLAIKFVLPRVRERKAGYKYKKGE